jgi:hypothetical protein
MAVSFRIVLIAAGLLLFWRLALVWWINPATFGESNYQANLIRIESYLRQVTPPDLVLVGSSLSGRLLPEYFPGAPDQSVANLGLDGGTPWAGLSVIQRGNGWPKVVLIETYLIDASPSPNDHTLVRRLDEPGTRLAQADPLFRSENRPSALLYNEMKQRRDSGHTPSESPALPLPALPKSARIQPSQPVDAQAQSSAVVDHPLNPFLAALKEQGVHTLFVDLPRGDSLPPAPSAPRPTDTAQQLADHWEIQRLDLRSAIGLDNWQPRYTDGVHLDAASARHLVLVLAKALDSLALQ